MLYYFQAVNLDDSSAELEVQLAELKMYCPDEKPPIIPTAETSADDLMAAAEEMMRGNKEVWHHWSLGLIRRHFCAFYFPVRFVSLMPTI